MSERLVHAECGGPVIPLAGATDGGYGPYGRPGPFSGWEVSHASRWFADDREERRVVETGPHEGTLRTSYVTTLDYLCNRCARAVSHNECVPAPAGEDPRHPRPLLGDDVAAGCQGDPQQALPPSGETPS